MESLMSELDDFKRYIAEGFQAAMVLRDSTEEELRRHQLPDAYFGVTVKILPLCHTDGRKLMYFLKEPDALAFAQSLVERQREVIGYDMCVYCSAVGPDTIHGRIIYLDDLISDLRILKGWDITKSEYPHTIEISFKIEGNDNTEEDARLTDVRKLALALTLRNKLGFVVSAYSPGIRFRGQPFSVKMGIQEKYVNGIDKTDIANVERIWRDDEAFTAVSALQTIYSQVTDDSRITVAWAAIEQLFTTKPEHLLNKSELSSVINAVTGLSCLSEQKSKRLLDWLKDANFLAKENRNARIAHNVSVLLGQEYEKTYLAVHELTNARGKRVHKLSGQRVSLTEHIKFAEQILWAFIDTRLVGDPIG
jgi:hypothetical protein